MNDIQLQQLWAEYDTRLEQAKLLNMQAWALNLQSKEAIQMHKAKSKLNKLASYKKWVVALGVIWVLLLSFLVFNTITWQGIFFNISAGAIAITTIIAIAFYIHHIVLIQKVDNSESIVTAQQTLALLQASTLRSIRIIWLQLPFYCTFYLSPALLQKAGTPFIIIHTAITLLFIWAAVWLYRNINYTNRHKKWFKFLMGSIEWTSIIKAAQFLDEVEEFKKEVE